MRRNNKMRRKRRKKRVDRSGRKNTNEKNSLYCNKKAVQVGSLFWSPI